MQTLSLENGKYELRFYEGSGALTAWRYGEPWQDFTGNKFIYLLMQAALVPQPLTREQIDAIWNAQGSFTDRKSDYRCFARAIERAHGIGGKS